MENARKYKVGLVQMRMGPDPDANLETAIAHIREAAKRGANIVCLPELFRAQYFCQREDIKLFDLAEPIPGPIDDQTCRGCTREPGRDRCFVVRASCARALPQHGRHARAGRQHHQRLSQDAHSRRSALLREVLFHAGRSWIQGRRYGFRTGRNACLLGPVVSRRSAADCAARSRSAVLSRRRSAGIRRRRRNSARRSMTRGRRSSAVTRLPTASMWQA